MTFVFSKDEMEALGKAVNSTGNIDGDNIWYVSIHEDIECIILTDTLKNMFSITFKKTNDTAINDVEDCGVKVPSPDAWRQR